MPIALIPRTWGMDRTTLARNLKPLQRDGRIRIETGEDRRSREVNLTRRGHRTLAQAYPLWKAAQKALEEALGSNRFERLLRDLSAAERSVRE